MCNVQAIEFIESGDGDVADEDNGPEDFCLMVIRADSVTIEKSEVLKSKLSSTHGYSSNKSPYVLSPENQSTDLELVRSCSFVAYSALRAHGSRRT